MIDHEKVIDGLEMLRFFNQRAWRELWMDKPHDVQEQDISNADVIYVSAISLLKEQEEKICSVKEIAMDESTNATWREDSEAWEVLDRIVQKLS